MSYPVMVLSSPVFSDSKAEDWSWKWAGCWLLLFFCSLFFTFLIPMPKIDLGIKLVRVRSTGVTEIKNVLCDGKYAYVR